MPIVFSVELPREQVHTWPAHTDCCPSCVALEGCRPIATEASYPVGAAPTDPVVVALYRHRGCGHVWYVSWIMEAAA